MSPETRQEYCRKLEEELSLLGTQLLSTGGASREKTLELARTFLTWSQVAVQGCGPWGKENLVLAQKIVLGIEGGRPLDKALERLSNAMIEASQNLEAEMLEGPSARKQAAKKDAPPPANGDYFNLPDEDVPGFKDFTAEAPEHLSAIERNLLGLSKGESWDVLQVYRAFHTIKGVCGFMNLPKMAALAHKAEARLEPFKSGQGRPSEDQVDWLLQVCDLVREQVQAITQGLPSGRFRIISFERLLDAEGPASSQAAPIPSNPASAEEKSEKAAESAQSHGGDASIRISVEKMDALLEIVGELAICQTQVSGGVEALGVTGHLASETSRLSKISRQLQDMVLSLRMVPVEPLFHRMTRLARDLSRKTERPLVLDLQGGETEIDRRMVEELVEPLVHLIRNAVDHGIEPAEERKRSGKETEARLTLSAKHQGGDFVLELSDDGRGLDHQKLEQKARELGLWTSAETPAIEWLSELIFKPGFSTANSVTEVSGRGVGLDAVKRKLQNLKGSVSLESEAGRGTTFTLRIPLTLALMDGILIRVAGQRYVLPASQVTGFQAFLGADEHSVGSGPKWLASNKEHLPLIDLKRNFGVGADRKLKPVVVRVEASGRRACLVVDEVLGKQQVVIKDLGENLHDLTGVAGGAILGDGKVGLILDVETLIGNTIGDQSQN